ncbi:MAG: ABC transporter ATP-binding protein [Bacteroidia bacterium]|jgi:lipoprotein-releasing system ATP-binding protein|nr:ABC transporter ATP-binding protein [Sphingobacteriaceae bacterium]MBK7311374.1 ABC transporter ATP-binding protein [Sphingobacteriaceae bacterium]MBK7818204.1 ABC transporter ATP-binding protein [Sphingobacteriaceae bacterium]MBP9068723.1 ABC transporter ATP-binding protein [Bacteroidia bacterium]
MIVAKQIHKSYGSLEILKGVDLHINSGEVVSIVGSSGAGKTTLLTILGTLDRPDSGQVLINGQNVVELNDKKLAAFRNENIGFVFQFHHLLPEFTALENICIPAFIAKKSKKESEVRALELLELFNLKDRATHKPSELSGGEQQRVAVARALINNPKVIFADEPSGNLDSKNADELHQLFFKLRDELKQTFVIVTHNNELAKMADRTLVMKDGRISI